ncbi:RagB/SusD family nutrient uptake outer membrane protein [Pedobacter nanyangensis]|uniref:RagB/SusD family nutrient uptake outer membrane protein n=1 Tax=Pedobacter nanyangensis TaxID=1562389 RepID=UPI000DE38E88|nr:RagB/SusD family nutrient uptake outer membrane protein [Pedobacter nanyangensis]
MKTHQFKLYGLFLLLTVQYACKKSFLEIEPKGKLTAQTANDYNLMLNNSYFDVTGADGQIYLGDEITSALPYYQNMATLKSRRYFEYAATIYEPDEDGSEFSTLTQHLYTYNIIINGVMDAQGGTDALKASYQAEALTNRAWIYLMLINYYGKPYLAQTAATDPGVPIITQADVTQGQFKRASVKEVYDFIINDLQKAIPALPISAGNRTRVSKAAAEALLARAYLYMGRYSEALTQLKSAFANLPTAFPVSLYDYKTVLAPNGSWGYSVGSPATYVIGVLTTPNNQEVLMTKFIPNIYTFLLNDLLITPSTYKLFTPTDQRLKLYTKLYFPGLPINAPNVYRRNGPYTTNIGVTLPDMYLMLAELKARTGDVGGARADLETFRSKRMLTATDAAVNITDPTAMIKFIMEERIREFAVQGYRWFDMRRLSVDPLFAGTSYKHEAISETGAVIASFPLKPERFVLRFPQKVINANTGMTNNP